MGPTSYEFQRRSLRIHKHGPLVKPMMILGSNGYSLDVQGPYYADGQNNDAAIAEHMISQDTGLKDWLHGNDVLGQGFGTSPKMKDFARRCHCAFLKVTSSRQQRTPICPG